MSVCKNRREGCVKMISIYGVLNVMLLYSVDCGVIHNGLYLPSSVYPPIPRTPYLRNRTSCDHNFWYTCVKWWYLQGFFLILIFWAVRGLKGQKVAENEK